MTARNYFMRHGKTVCMVALLAVLVCLPAVLPYYPRRVLMLSLIYVILASSVNIVTGYTGQMSLGQSGFYAVGAYASALLSTRLGVPFWAALFLSAMIAGACGVLVGLPSFRVRGIYLAIITLMFASIVSVLALNLRGITGGYSGVLGIPRPEFGSLAFVEDEDYYYLILISAALTVALSYRLERAQLGRALMAIRDDETAAGMLGLNTRRYKLFAFAVSAFVAGAAGSLYAHFAGFISVESFPASLSITILVMAIVGGLGRIEGAVIGALVVYTLPEVLRFSREFWNIIFGATMILIVLLLPGGLASVPQRLRPWVRRLMNGQKVT